MVTLVTKEKYISMSSYKVFTFDNFKENFYTNMPRNFGKNFVNFTTVVLWEFRHLLSIDKQKDGQRETQDETNSNSSRNCMA
jgi:hypothetical protein